MYYFDHAATTRVRPEVVELMARMMVEDYGNPSAVYRFGQAARKELDRARQALAQVLGVDPASLVFTSGGTEANNLAILGAATGNKEENFLCFELEHSSVRAAHRQLAQTKAVHWIKSRQGFLDLEDLQAQVNDQTRLVSVMMVNNELGHRYPIEEIGRFLKKNYPRTLFHVDGIQALGKLPLDLAAAGVDLFSMSSHKIHGPKGVGALYVRPGVHLHPLLVGGAQEGQRRAGTENVPGIVGFAWAAQEAQRQQEANLAHVRDLALYVRQQLEDLEGAQLLSDPDQGSPYILSYAFAGIKSEVLVHYLEQDQVYVSNGSACNQGALSPVIQALGLDPAYAQGAIRISFADDSSLDQVQVLVAQLKAAIQTIRRIVG